MSAAPQASITPPMEKAAVRKIRVVPSMALTSLIRSVFIPNSKSTDTRVIRVLFDPVNALGHPQKHCGENNNRR